MVKQLSYIGSGWEGEGAPLMLSAPPLTPMEYDSPSTWSAMGTALFSMGAAWLYPNPRPSYVPNLSLALPPTLSPHTL